MTRAVPDCAFAFVRAHEGLKLKVSADVAGTLDAGYGHTGPELKPGLTITRSTAEAWLKLDLAQAARRLERVVHEPVILDLTENQYATLLAFVFNVGCQPSWTIWKLLNAKSYDQIPAQLARFVNAGGNKVQGLVNRRNAEIALWSTAEPGSVPDEPSSAVTRLADTPPTPSPAPSKAPLIGSAMLGLGAVSEGAKQVSNIVAPYADRSDLVQHALSMAATVGAGAAVLVAVLVWLQHRAAQR